MIKTVKNKIYQYSHLLCILTLIACNFIIFREHYLGHLVFPWDFTDAYHSHAVNWYLDSSLCNQAQYIPWLGGGIPAGWILQNSSYYLPLHLLDWLEIPYALSMAVIIQCLHHLFAMVGVYILLLRLKGTAVTALIAALIYGTGATFYSNAQHVDIVRGAAWLPWVVFFVLPPIRLNIGRRILPRLVYILLPIFVFHQFLVSSYPGIVATSFPFVLVIFLYYHFIAFPTDDKRKIYFPVRISWIILTTAGATAALLAAPKLLPFIDMVLADGITSFVVNYNISWQDLVKILSTLVGVYQGEFVFDWTMRSLGIAPIALLLLPFLRLTRDNVFWCVLVFSSIVILVLELSGYPIEILRKISRFPLSDHRPIFHLAVSIAAGLVCFELKTLGEVKSKRALTIFFFLILILMGLSVVNYHASDNAAGVALTLFSSGLFLFSLCYFGWTFRVITILLLICAGMIPSFEMGFIWRTPFSFPAEKQYYGNEFVSVPAGKRPEIKMLRRPQRFLFREDSPLSHKYSVAVFNSSYGLYGYNNLKRSKLWGQRRSTLHANHFFISKFDMFLRHKRFVLQPSIVLFRELVRDSKAVYDLYRARILKSQFEIFALQPGVVLVGEPDDDIIKLIKKFKVEHCDAEGLCLDEKQQDHGMILEWKEFSAEQIRFSIQHNHNQERLFLLNENAFPGWRISAFREGARQHIPLVKNDLGLVAFRLPAGDSLVTLQYQRSIYKWSNIVALGGIVLMGVLIVLLSMPLQRFKSLKVIFKKIPLSPSR